MKIQKKREFSLEQNQTNGRPFIPATNPVFKQTATQSRSLVRYTKLNPERIFSYMSFALTIYIHVSPPSGEENDPDGEKGRGRIS